MVSTQCLSQKNNCYLDLLLNGTAAQAATRLWYRDRLSLATRHPETLVAVEVTEHGRRTVADSARASRLYLVASRAWVDFMFVGSDDQIMILETKEALTNSIISILLCWAHRHAHATAKNLLSLKRRSLEIQMKCTGNHPVDRNKIGHTRYQHHKLAFL